VSQVQQGRTMMLLPNCHLARFGGCRSLLSCATAPAIPFCRAARPALRISTSRAARWAIGFRICLALIIEILPRVTKGRTSTMTDKPNGNEHRWGRRIAVDIPVQVAAKASPAIHGQLKNVSLSGALMEADHELLLHASIEVSIEPAETGHSPRKVMARVTRKSKNAVGVEWCEFAPSAVKDLLRSPSIRLPL
jgi:hypothetical protein